MKACCAIFSSDENEVDHLICTIKIFPNKDILCPDTVHFTDSIITTPELQRITNITRALTREIEEIN